MALHLTIIEIRRKTSLYRMRQKVLTTLEAESVD